MHDHLTRKSEKVGEFIPIIRHRCAKPTCGATWRILPAFLARHVHRVWRTIERTVDEDKRVKALDIPATTVRRWRSRMASAAKHLMVLLAASGGALLGAVAKAAGLGSTRTEFVDAYVDQAKAWAEEENAKGPLCACGGGQSIRVKARDFKTGASRYIRGHHLRAKR